MRRANGEFELLVDHDKLSSDDVPYPESYECFKGRICKRTVIRFEPPRLLETTFPGRQEWHRHLRAVPEGGRTRLVLTHSGITSPSGFQDFGGGWNSHMRCSRSGLPAAASAISGRCTGARARR